MLAHASILREDYMSIILVIQNLQAVVFHGKSFIRKNLKRRHQQGNGELKIKSMKSRRYIIDLISKGGAPDSNRRGITKAF